MIRISLLLIIVTLLASCNSCNNNKSNSGATDSANGFQKDPGTDTISTTDTTAKANTDPGTEKPAPPTTRSANNDKNSILANIDNYLISKPDISNSTLTIQNNLKDATINKAYSEVAVVDANGATLRSTFLIFENIKPLDSKSVRIPDVSGGATITSHIVRLKSDELTNGETILVGSRYSPK